MDVSCTKFWLQRSQQPKTDIMQARDFKACSDQGNLSEKPNFRDYGIFYTGALLQAEKTGKFQKQCNGWKKGRTVVVCGPGSSIVVVIIVVDDAVVVCDEGVLSSLCTYNAFPQPQHHELKEQIIHSTRMYDVDPCKH